MVSIPGDHPNGNTRTNWWMFSDITANLFGYNGIFYPVTTITQTEGYFMKHIGARTYNTGDEWPAGGIIKVPNEPFFRSGGWQLIGVFECPVAASNIVTVPPGCLSSPIYGYSGSYFIADSLYPGYAYWVKLSCSALIVLPQCEGIQRLTEINRFVKDDWGKILFTDADGRSFKLYLVNGETDLSNYELPPVPPAGLFDIRFGSRRIAEEINGEIKTIELSGVSYPLTIRVENADIRLMDESGKMINSNLSSGEEIVITESTIQKLVVSSELIPSEFSLKQNYPNPFNSNTTIIFAVPKETLINLSVFNILGEKIIELKNEIMKPGTYEVNFDASALASGMYLYKLQAGSFSSIKKMVLMK
jgi:hypothetical protein